MFTAIIRAIISVPVAAASGASPLGESSGILLTAAGDRIVTADGTPMAP